MKKLDKLAKLSKEHEVSTYISFLETDTAAVEIFDGGKRMERVCQEDGETLGGLIGRAVDVIEAEFVDEPEDKITIKISVRLDQQTGERWTAHQFPCSPIAFAHLSGNIYKAISNAHKEYEGTNRPYGEWFDIITVIVRMPDGMWVDLRMARDERDSSLWHTQEDYRRAGKSARFIDKTENTPTPELISGFIKNALDIAGKLAERANPAIS